MSSHVAFLRGINVGSKNAIGMEDLRAMFVRLGMTDVQSLLRTGNIIFRPGKLSRTSLEKLLETETAAHFGVTTSYMVRSIGDLRKIGTENPFPEAAASDPSHLVVLLLKDVPKDSAVMALRAAITGREVIHVAGNNAYVFYPDGIGDSRLNNSIIDAKLKTRSTGRNWNTVNRLLGMIETKPAR